MSRGRGYQREQRDRIIDKRVNELRALGFEHLRAREPGRWFKRHPLDCGNPRCGMCRDPERVGARARDKRAWQKHDLDA